MYLFLWFFLKRGKGSAPLFYQQYRIILIFLIKHTTIKKHFLQKGEWDATLSASAPLKTYVTPAIKVYQVEDYVNILAGSPNVQPSVDVQELENDGEEELWAEEENEGV